jgi:glycosyltransferase involved in cell wall biosynthesis
VHYITVARISERKNQLQVLESLARLRQRHQFHFHYTIVGNVDSRSHDAYLESLSQFANAHGLMDAVSIVARATDDEKIDCIDASDVFVMLSRPVGHSVEGFGISVIEASCRGKPVVVSDHGGMPETVVDGHTGFTVPLGDEGRIDSVLLQLGRQPSLRSTLGANGIQFVRDRFTPRRMADALVAQLCTPSTDAVDPVRLVPRAS